MTGLRRALWSVAFAGIAAGAAASALVVASDHIAQRGLAIAIGLLIAWSFIGTGLYAWWRRPGNRFGALMTAVGFTFLLDALVASDESVVFTIGVILSGVYFVVFAHMVVTYPEGRLERRWHAWLIGAGYLLTLAGSLPQLLWGFAPGMECDGCPPSALLISDDAALRDLFNTVASVLGVALVAVVLVILIRRWMQATAPQRRAMAPVLWSGIVMLVLLGSQLGSDAAGVNRLTDVFGTLGLIVFASVPWVFLIGLVRSRVLRAGAVSELLLRLGEAPGTGSLRHRLADALGDRALELVFWLDDKGRWVDANGHKVELPDERDPARAWTAVELEGRRGGAVVPQISPRARLDRRGARGPAGGRDRARHQPRRGPGDAALGRRRRRPGDGERAAPGPAARPRGGAAHLARPDRRGRHARAPPARAQPARRRAAAARRALAHAAARADQAAQGSRRRRRAPDRRPRRAHARARRAARARPRHPSGDPVRPRARGGAGGTRRPLAGRRRS